MPVNKHDGYQMDLDSILKELGHFGKFQLLNCLFICITILLFAMYAMSYVFTAGVVNHRCLVPDCDDPSNPEFKPSWLGNAVPYDWRNSDSSATKSFEKCERFARNLTVPREPECPKTMFSSTFETCDQWVFEDDTSTIQTEWNLTCEDNEWKLALIGTINNVGQFVCLTMAGIVSDKFGRRTVLVFGIVTLGMIGIVKSFSVNYLMFVFLEFFGTVLGTGCYTAGYILGMELVQPRKRVLGGAVITCFFAFGEALVGAISWKTRSWRLLLRIIHPPALLLLSYFWLIPESIRWLMVQGRRKEVAKVIKNAARTNNVVLSDMAMQKLTPGSNSDSDETEDDERIRIQTTQSWKSFLKSTPMILRVLNCSFCWFTNAFVFYGLSLNSVAIAGNKYLNFILVSLIEVPAHVVTYILSDRLGRRTLLCGALISSGVACFASKFVATDLTWLRLVMFLYGKFSITISFAILYVYTTELFPTSMRHSILASCSMLGRVGSMIAPQTPLLARYMDSLPLILFGGTALTSGSLILFFPETLNIRLPDTIEEAENIGKPEIKT
ncbi:organic cation transporter protein-like isoform X2 [Ctenocephalides felis]|nr:organic cation transporter protein-like isoform X2 [Ctenocephalides felis]